MTTAAGSARVRPHVPDSTAYMDFMLVPKGTRLRVLTAIRPYPRARRIDLEVGTYDVVYVSVDHSVDKEDPALTYYLLKPDNRLTGVRVNGPEAKHVLTGDGDPIYDSGIADDNKPWGWYGLDWTFDPDLEDTPSDGYVRLRRMKKVG